MIVSCDQCGTSFNIDDQLIKKGRTKLRCASCKHVFQVIPPSKPIDSPIKEPRSPDAGGNGGGNAEDDTKINFSEEVFDRFGKMEARYLDLGSIGEGGMGEVKLAKDTQLLRKVAVKVLKKEAAASPAALSYFLREAQITAQLDHPNIVPLYTVKEPDTDEKNVSFVMKLIKGQTLTDIITRSRQIFKEDPKAELPPELDLNARLGYFLKACDGVIYAHSKEVIHRDLKPSNVMVGDYGEVYVMDWGIAKRVKEMPETLFGIQKVAARKSELYVGGTELGSVVGTPGYISPEQVKGLPDVGQASDQFSLGVMLYELVTLKPARPGDMTKKLAWAEEGEINQLTHMLPEKKIAPELKAIIRKATAFDPEDRYPSVSILADDVRRFLRGDEVSQLPDNLPRKMWRWMNKHRHLTAIVVLSFLLISSGVTIWNLVSKQVAMKNARIREKKLTHLLTKVSAQAHYIDSRFMRLEDQLANLVDDALYLIENAPENQERLYWQSDFLSPGRAPSDLALSPLYGQPVSVDYPVVKLAPGVTPDEVRPMMQRLAPLRYHFRQMLLNSRGNSAPLSEEEARRRITIHGLPVSWVFLGLEAGVMYSYPGKGRYPEGYDPRLRPWYRFGAHKEVVSWGNPYIDVQGLGRVLPCATAIHDQNGRMLGVAGMDVTYTTIIQDALTRSGAVGVVESFLLDEKGRVVVSSSQLGMPLEAFSTDSALQLELFPVQAVVDKVLRKESGLEEVTREGEPRIIFFHGIPSLNWYYAEEVRTAAVLGPDLM